MIGRQQVDALKFAVMALDAIQLKEDAGKEHEPFDELVSQYSANNVTGETAREAIVALSKALKLEIEVMTFKTVGKTRDEFLKMYPKMDDWLEKMESFHGQMLKAGGVGLDAGRAVIMVRFERAWNLCLHNPANSGESKDANFNLSNEAMCVFTGIFFALASEKADRQAMWDNTFAAIERAQNEQGENNQQTADSADRDD